MCWLSLVFVWCACIVFPYPYTGDEPSKTPESKVPTNSLSVHLSLSPSSSKDNQTQYDPEDFSHAHVHFASGLGDSLDGRAKSSGTPRLRPPTPYRMPKHEEGLQQSSPLTLKPQAVDILDLGSESDQNVPEDEATPRRQGSDVSRKDLDSFSPRNPKSPLTAGSNDQLPPLSASPPTSPQQQDPAQLHGKEQSSQQGQQEYLPPLSATPPSSPDYDNRPPVANNNQGLTEEEQQRLNELLR